MSRNPFWTASDASLATFLIGVDDGPTASFSASTSTSYEYGAATGGLLSSSDTLDFTQAFLLSNATYTIVGTGSFQVGIGIYDSSGYLLNYTCLSA